MRIVFISLFILFTSYLSAQEVPAILNDDIFYEKLFNHYIENPIEFDSPFPNNLHYRVKVGSFKNDPDPNFFKYYYPVTARSNETANRYYIGLFTTFQKAEEARKLLLNDGYKGAFLVAFENGQEISLSKAYEKEISGGVEIEGNFVVPEVKISMELTEEGKKSLVDTAKLNDPEYYLDYYVYDVQNAKVVPNLVSEAEEIIPMVWPGDSVISFSRALYDGNTGGKESGHDIWISRLHGDLFSQPYPFKRLDSKYNDAVVGVSKDGNRVYLMNDYSTKHNIKGLSVIERELDSWSYPKKVEIPHLNFKGNFYSLFVHPDEDLILVSMEAPDTFGKNDLYLILKNSDGNWGPIQHLSAKVNSGGNDISPFMGPSKKILFCSTDGRGGVGGHDIVAYKRLDAGWEQWSEVQNLGPEINSPQFEAYPFIAGDRLFFTHAEEEGLSNIYEADIVNTMIAPIEHNIELEDSLLFTYNVEAGTLKNESNEALALNSIPVLQMVNTDARIDMIYFDYDRYNLKPSFIDFLDQLYTILKDHPEINMDLRGHTDAMGSDEYNYQLGESRALSVKDYLISIGISPRRIQVKSYGRSQPIASNDTKFGRAKNRRVEIRFFQ